MNPTTFPRYSAPASLEDAAEQARLPETRLLGGGTVLYPLLQRGEVAAGVLIDLFGLPDTKTIASIGDAVRVGAMTTYADILNESNVPLPALLRTAAAGITGGPQLRNQGTIGGSACYANPASDMPSVLVALQAELHVVGGETGERSIPASDFFVGPFATSRREGEILVAVVVPNDTPGDTWGRYKLKTAEGGWPIGVAAACVRPNPSSSGGTVTLTLGALTETPIELAPVELRDRAVVSAVEQAHIRSLVSDADPAWWSDELADADYRHRVAGTVAVRALFAAIEQGKSNG